MPICENQKGVSIIAAVFIIVILAFMGVIFLALFTTSNSSSVNDLQSAQALSVAEGGAEYAILQFNAGTACNALVYAQTLGAGNFATNGVLYNPAPTTLQVAIPDAVSTNPVTVNSTAGFAPHGRIVIGTEYIHYDSISGNTFTGIRRGAGGSTAAAHGIGSAVIQNECLITSIGTVNTAQRTVERSMSIGGGAGIVFDAASRERGNNVNSISWSHTVAGTNRIIIVGVSLWNNTNQTVNTVTYAGQALNLLGAQNNGTNGRVELWYRVAPALGANNIAVTLQGGQNARMIGGAVSLRNVDQTNPIDAVAIFNSATSNAPNVAINTVTDNAWVIDTLGATTDVSAAVGPGQTERWNWNTTGGAPGTRYRGAGSTEPRSPAGAVNMTWGLASVQPWVIGAVAIRPSNAQVGSIPAENTRFL